MLGPVLPKYEHSNEQSSIHLRCSSFCFALEQMLLGIGAELSQWELGSVGFCMKYFENYAGVRHFPYESRYKKDSKFIVLSK